MGGKATPRCGAMVRMKVEWLFGFRSQNPQSAMKLDHCTRISGVR
jgi:hypothetical protein